MQGDQRRAALLQLIEESQHPISGTALAEKLGVSRQIVVQDIALIRAQGNEILSTNRGYKLQKPSKKTKIFKVRHSNEEIADELNAIVDLGATVEDVFIDHEIYGRIYAKLGISSRRQVTLFLKEITTGSSIPLMNVTDHYHYHTISADTDEILSLVEQTLAEKKYLQ